MTLGRRHKKKTALQAVARKTVLSFTRFGNPVDPYSNAQSMIFTFSARGPFGP